MNEGPLGQLDAVVSHARDRIPGALAQAEVPLTLGSMLGRYRLLEQIGKGAFGDVWRAEDTSSKTSAAVKVFARTKFSPDSRAAAAERFHDGASAMRKLSECREVVRILEGPTVEILGGHIWFSMAYHEARDLNRWRAGRELSVEERVSLLGDVLSALTAAHAMEVVHRDVRPPNILIDASGDRPRAILTDFDIAYYEDFLRQRDTTIEVLGSRRYIPPEVYRASAANVAAMLRRPQNDLYALAVVTLDLFATKEIDVSPSRAELLAALPKKSKRNTSGLSGGFRRDLATFLQRALSLKEGERFQTIAQYQGQWNVVKGTPRWWSPTMLLAGAVLFAGCLVMADWLWFLKQNRPVWQTAEAVACAGFSVCSGIGVVGSMASLIGSATPRWGQGLRSWLLAWPLWSVAVTLLLAAVALSGALSSNLPHRLTTARIVLGIECVAVDRVGVALPMFRREFDEGFSVTGVQEVRCRSEGGGPRVEGMSLLTPLPPLASQDHPRARVQIIEVAGPTQVTADFGGAAKRMTLAGVRMFSVTEGLALSTQGLSALIERGDIKVPLWGSVAFGFSSDKIELDVEGQNVALLLLRKGLLQANPDDNVGDEYGRAEADARGAKAGMWLAILMAEHRADVIKQCGQCCRPDVPCKEEKSCAERAKCYACVAHGGSKGEERYWRLSLPWRLGIGNREWWEPHSIKVCVTAGNNACGQMCVDEDRAGDPVLGTFGCYYSSSDFESTTLAIIARPLGHAPERIAEKQVVFMGMGTAGLCKGLLFRDLTAKKDSVDTVFLDARVEAPDSK